MYVWCGINVFSSLSNGMCLLVGQKHFFFFQQMKGYARTESVETTKTDFVWDYFTLSTA